MERALAKSFVLLALILICKAHPHVEKVALRNEDSRDSSVLNSDTSSTVKEDVTPFGTNACLYIPQNLPACDFHRNERSADNAGDPRVYTKDSFDSISSRPHSLNPKLTSRNGIESSAADVAAAGFTVYKIEGCIPSRLPFNMPLCKELGPIGKVADVRRLYPFTVSNPARSSYVFPEFDLDAWMRTMNGMRANKESATDDSADEDEANGLMPGAITGEYTNGSSDDPVVDAEESTAEDRLEKRENEKGASKEKREISWHETVDSDHGLTSVKREVRTISGRAWNSNPFANTIFLEPSQNLDTLDELRAWNKASEPIESEPSVREPDFDDLNVLLGGTSGRSSRQRRQSKLNNEIGEKSESHEFDPFARRKDDVRRKSRDVKVGSEFPYWKAIPYDPKRLMRAGISIGVDDSRSRKTRDTAHSSARNSLKGLRGLKGKFEELGTGEKRRGEETSRIEPWPRMSPKTYWKERTDKVKANGSRTRTTLRKIGSSRAPLKHQKKKDSKRGRRFGR